MQTFIHICKTISEYAKNDIESDAWMNTDLIAFIKPNNDGKTAKIVTKDGECYLTDGRYTYETEFLLQQIVPAPPKPANYGTTGYTDF